MLLSRNPVGIAPARENESVTRKLEVYIEIWIIYLKSLLPSHHIVTFSKQVRRKKLFISPRKTTETDQSAAVADTRTLLIKFYAIKILFSILVRT
jgi:hypothetical protein